MSKPRSYIVTGGAGFVGSNLVAALQADEPDARITVIDDFRTGSFAAIAEACDRHAAGPFTGRVIPEAIGDIDWDQELEETQPACVFHLAAITDTTVADERRMISENADAFRWILESCVDAGIPLVYASSAATYGTPEEAEQREPFPLESAGFPNNVYGFSKWLMEVEHRRIASDRLERNEPQPKVFGLRYFNVFGQGESRKGKMSSMIYQLTLQILAGKNPRVFADGSQSRDQVYVDDVVGCTLAAAGLGEREDPEPGVYNVGSGQATSFNQIVDAIRAALDIRDTQLPTQYFDMPPAIREFYQDYTCADMSVTEWGLGWKPLAVPTEAIAAYAKWLSERTAHPSPVASVETDQGSGAAGSSIDPASDDAGSTAKADPAE
jgi:ADP-L-glycero-D-manno-heptose 6-epimerase